MSVTFDRLRELDVRRIPLFGHTLNGWTALEWAGAMCGEAGEAAWESRADDEMVCRFRLALLAFWHDEQDARPPTYQECRNWLCSIVANEDEDMKLAQAMLGFLKDTRDAEFWRRMYVRQRCGCVAKDCLTHGSYNPADVTRLRSEGVL